MRVLIALVLAAPVLACQPAGDARSAIERALPMVQEPAATFVAERSCVSCHHNSLALLALHSASRHGIDVDQTAVGQVESATFRAIEAADALDAVVQSVTLGDPTPTESYMLMAADASGIEQNRTLEAYVRRLLGWQRDGHWVTSDFRPPQAHGLFTATATAVRAVTLYGAEEQEGDIEAAVARAREWLTSNRPTSAEDAAFRLMGLVWASASGDQVATAREDLLAFRGTDGGFFQLPGYASDAYATGEALVALHLSGVASDDPNWQGGIAYLLSTQAADGTWHVATRMLSPADVSPPYFETGFPYGQDEFISYSGTCWAVMALADVLPETSNPAVTRSLEEVSVPEWVSTALWGTTDDLQRLLDAGLDPNSRTEGGTTLLMAVAPEADKVRILLEKGADASVRTASGADALAVAAAYYGTADSVRALLDAGAGAPPPEGVRIRRPPLFLASRTGDADTVRQLLDAGADPDASAPLAEAVTLGYDDIAQSLIDAGARASIAESTGINLLHWAVITHRVPVIRVLAEAGVSIDAVDGHGFTPLMYAATIDFGDTGTVDALLDAGADPAITSPEGRTPLEQAELLSHDLLAEALRRPRL